MLRFIVRVWLPDRPGALGRVATSLGAAGISLIGIEIIEQGGGWAVDELVVDVLPTERAGGPEATIVAALQELDGVRVESIVLARGEIVDPRIDALETAAELAEQTTQRGLAAVLVQRSHHDLNAEWAVLIDDNHAEPVASAGTPPAAAWIRAFVGGSRTAEAGGTYSGAEDVAWAAIHAVHSSIVLGRNGRPFRPRERGQLAAIARIVSTLWERAEK